MECSRGMTFKKIYMILSFRILPPTCEAHAEQARMFDVRSPRRGCLFVKHLARPAPSSTSATKDWCFLPAPYIRTKRRSCPSPRLSPQTVFPDDQTAQALFSATQTTSTLFPEVDRRTSWGGGRAARGVSPWSLFCCLRISVAGGAKKHQTAVIFSACFGRELPPRARPDRRPDLRGGSCCAAGLRSLRFHFGDFASRAWRVLSGI